MSNRVQNNVHDDKQASGRSCRNDFPNDEKRIHGNQHEKTIVVSDTI